MLKFNLIAAATQNLGIGKNNTLPWKLKEEMNYFNRMTRTTKSNSKKNVVIMGRKTWDSIPLKFRPLKDRINFILSKSNVDLEQLNDVYGFTSWDDIYDKLNDTKFKEEYEQIWIVGGSYIYKHALESKYFYRLYLTEIKKNFDCDVFFPTFSDVKEVVDPAVPQGLQKEGEIEYEFKVYQKASIN